MTGELVIPGWLVALVGRLVIENEALKQPAPVPENDKRGSREAT